MNIARRVPSRFRAVMWDQMMFFVRKVADQQVRCVVDFDGRVDENRMAKAVRLSLDAMPITGCRYVERWWRPYWERLEHFDANEVFTILQTKDVEGETHSFLTQQIDPFEGPQLRVRVLRAQTDTLCLNMNHMVGDAEGLKQFAYLLASIYSNLTEDPEYTPRYTERNRSLRQVSKHIGLLDKIRILYRALRGQSDSDNWRLPLSSGGGCRPAMVVRKLPGSRFDAIRAYGKRYQATLNDVVLAAYYRALSRVIQSAPGKPLRISVTVDLRRYIPPGKAGGICNLSGFAVSDIGRELGAGLEETLVKVRNDMNIKKANWPGLDGIALIVAPFKMLPYAVVKNTVYHILGGMPEPNEQRAAMPPTLTNMGVVDSEKLVFGDIGVRRAYTTGAVNYPPGFQLGFSSYNRSLTFSLLTCDVGDNAQLAERLLDLLEKELPM